MVSGNPVVSARLESSGDRRDALCHEIGVGLTSPTADAIHTTLAIHSTRPNASMMFMITEADADAIRAVYHEHGELSAAIELRCRFPGIMDNAEARMCAWTIAGWKSLPSPPGSVTRLEPAKRRR